MKRPLAHIFAVASGIIASSLPAHSYGPQAYNAGLKQPPAEQYVRTYRDTVLGTPAYVVALKDKAGEHTDCVFDSNGNLKLIATELIVDMVSSNPNARGYAFWRDNKGDYRVRPFDRVDMQHRYTFGHGEDMCLRNRKFWNQVSPAP